VIVPLLAPPAVDNESITASPNPLTIENEPPVFSAGPPATVGGAKRLNGRLVLLGAAGCLSAFGLFSCVGLLLWMIFASSSATQIAEQQSKSAATARAPRSSSIISRPTSFSTQPVPITGKSGPTSSKSPPTAKTPTPIPPVPSNADSASPLLVLDAGGHTAVVRKIGFTPDNQRLVTVSHDKTVRIWDVASGEVLQVIRLPIGPGVEGQLEAVAISPDGQRIAVGGTPFGLGKLGVLIHVLSLETGQVQQVLKGNREIISSLAFSSDGKRLLASSNDGIAVIYDVTTGQALHELTGHKDRIFSAVFSPDGKRVATASPDRTGRLWSATTGQLEVELKGHSQPLISVAWSPDGQTIATGHLDATICLYNPDGKLLKRFTGLKNQITSLTFTPDNKRLLFTGVGWGAGNEREFGSTLLEVATGQEALRFRGHNNTVMQGVLSADGKLAASTGGDNSDTFVWKTSDGSLVQHLVGKGRGIFGVGFGADGRSIAYGTINASSPGTPTPLQRTFRLDQLEPGPPPDARVRRAQPARGALELMRGPDFSMVLVNAGKPVHAIPFPGGKSELCYCWTFISDTHAVAGTAYGLYLVDVRANKLLRRYTGHASMVMAVAPSPDNRYFVTGSPDQTICVWSVDQEQPLVSLFCAGDEWIAWTPEGYYAASALGERLMGWQLNRGPDSVASYFPAAQFRKSLFQPEVIKLLLQTGSVQKAIVQAAREQKQAIASVTVAQVLPPTVTITSPSGGGSIYTKQTRLEVSALARSVGPHPVTAMRLLVDGRPYNGQAGLRTFNPPRTGEAQQSWSVDLTPGKHVIAVQAESPVSKGLSPLVEVNCTAGKPSDLPNLHVLAVGINAYPGKMELNYAVPDAEALVQAVQKSKAFGKVTVNLLTDKRATKAQIMKGLDQLGAAMTPQDVGILFFSGHGDRDEKGNLQLIPVDVNPRDLENSCVSGEHLKNKLGEMSGRLIAIFDACHSGAAADPRQPGRLLRPLTDDLVRDLVTDDYGVIVMCSSQGREYSLESADVKHGYFTYALVEGLAGKADLNRDGAVFLNELDIYTARRVKALSEDRQHPASARPPNIRPFVLARP
jgi:WD40 repeat protein